MRFERILRELAKKQLTNLKSRITTSRIRVHQTGTSGRSKYRLASFRKKRGWGRSKKLTRDKVCDTWSNCEQRAPELLLISIDRWVPKWYFRFSIFLARYWRADQYRTVQAVPPRNASYFTFKNF